MSFIKICVLAVIQGLCELLPVSSSAHVVVAEKLMGLDPTSPETTFLLVMLHTGTMFAVIFYFRRVWTRDFFESKQVFTESLKVVAAATAVTGVFGLALKFLIEKIFLGGMEHAEIELIFGNLALVSASLAVVGVLIIFSGLASRRKEKMADAISFKSGIAIGAVQGVCLPFRGFSRSGATISTGLLLGVSRLRVESFSFALAVVLTPPVVLRELLRLLRARHSATLDAGALAGLFYPGLVGMALSFLAGLVALKWLSSWLEHDRWHLFGVYCLFAAGVVFGLHLHGF
ncbi:MAG: undecaprenyl-diphosphate phosphatase [Nitrospinae bacterium]|nr:undecaprenyl-diphosphate phosphatase [Nitrospinota bacterium]